MVERWTNPDDGRSTLVAPTDAGRAVALEAAATLNAEVFADVGLGPDDRRAALDMLARWRHAYGDFE